MFTCPNFINFHHAGVALAYLALLILQPVWHALAPTPLGAESWWLALVATGPLLFPLRGILKGKLRSMTWGGYLLVFYLVVGITEAWSNPPQRLPALLQTALVTLCIYGMLRFSSEQR
ncbi:MAG: DUF2069 domain-containing protein [Xanthomonadales bacterium]